MYRISLSCAEKYLHLCYRSARRSLEGVSTGLSIDRHQLRNMSALETLKFDNVALKQLPVDPVVDGRQRLVCGACFSRVSPTPVSNPRLVIHSPSALGLIGLSDAEVQRPEFVDYFSGNRLLPGAEPAAHCYCGHQFGYFAGQLGDGAAMYMGEILNELGERWELQLKGSGKTPFSRTADGRKVLRSSIREFLCSEAMYYLNVPTTRAGCCLTSDSTVVRDVFYTGEPLNENCAVISRIAPTFIRFGSFQVCKPPDRESGRDGPSAGRPEILQQLADYVIRQFYPKLLLSDVKTVDNVYVKLFREIVHRTATLVAHWQTVGFCHGVLNTDNMSIVGLTIDYGPFGFLDRYDPNHVCNASDDGGRYAYSKQPEICKWNCLKLAEALSLLAPLDQLLSQLDNFDKIYQQSYMDRLYSKCERGFEQTIVVDLGVTETGSPKLHVVALGLLTLRLESDSELFESLFDTMHETGADFTNTFRCLSHLSLRPTDEQLTYVKHYLLEQCATVEELQAAYAPRMDPRQLAMFKSLLASKPELLLQAGKGFRQISIELDRHEKLQQLKQLTTDSKQQQDKQRWDDWLKLYIDRLQAEQITDIADNTRRTVMNSVNPSFILRNYIAQNAINAAVDDDDFSEVERVFKLLQRPFDEPSSDVLPETRPQTAHPASCDDAAMTSVTWRSAVNNYYNKPPSWSTKLRVT